MVIAIPKEILPGELRAHALDFFFEPAAPGVERGEQEEPQCEYQDAGHGDDGDQHEGAPGHCVEKELEAGIDPPLAAPAVPPGESDRATFAEKTGLPVEAIGYTDFIAGGKWDVDDVLRPIYQEASEAVGREFPYPGDK